MGSSLLVLQHIACEPPAAFEDELRSRGLDVTRVELDEGDPLPDWREFPAIVVMGGPMGAYDEADHPGSWRRSGCCARPSRPTFRCGASAWARSCSPSALGARVYRGEQPEVGLLPVELTSEAAEIPSSAERRAPSRRCSGTATASTSRRAPPCSRARPRIRIRRSGWAARTAFSSTSRSRSSWRPNGATCRRTPQSLESTLGPGALDRLLADVADHADVTVPLARYLFGRWLEQVVRVPVAHAGS